MSEESKGQRIRKRIRETVENQLHKYCPNTFNKMANLIAYDLNLTPDTIRYNYLPMFIDAGILEYDNDNMVVLTAKGLKVQTTEDGLTEQQLREELDEENENRAKLGQHKVTLEEWKETRSSRIKPLKRG